MGVIVAEMGRESRNGAVRGGLVLRPLELTGNCERGSGSGGGGTTADSGTKGVGQVRGIARGKASERR